MPFHLLAHERFDDGLRRIAREQLDIVVGHLDDDAMPFDDKVHSVRMRCKKLRGLLRLPQPVMGAAFEVEDHRFRDAARQLAVHRDGAVRSETAQAMGESAEAAAARRADESAAVLTRARHAMTDCRRAVDDWPMEVRDFADVAPGFSRTAHRAADAWLAAQRNPADAVFHRLRKWTKYHWYQVRILQPLDRPGLRERRSRLRRLQLVLGKAHDAAVLQAAEEAGAHPDAVLLESTIRHKEALYRKATRLGRRVFATRVDELVAGLARGSVGWVD